jgi:hypothetical protein
MSILKFFRKKNNFPHTIPLDLNAKREKSLQARRESAIQEFETIPIPPNLIDPCLFQPFVDPVITSHGRIYSSRSIRRHLASVNTDPLTQAPLTVGQLFQAPEEIMKIITEFQQLQKDTKNKLLQVDDTDVDAVSELLRSYRFRLERLDSRMETECKKLVTQAAIQNIKNNLKIDEKNKEHISFWQNKGKRGCNIPTHVRMMMRAANDSFDSVEEFLEAVNAERHLTPYESFFKYTFRDKVTRELYNQSEEKIKTFVVQKK